MFIFAEYMDAGSKYDTLVLVTNSFPFGGFTEASFVMPEVSELAQSFRRVIIIPTISDGQRQHYDLPDNVEISTSWLEYPDWKHRWLRTRYVFSPGVWRTMNGSVNYTSLTFALAARSFAGFVDEFVKREKLDWGSTLFYTFWFDLATAGLALVAERRPVNYLSRAHGHDIYMDRCNGLRAKAARRSKAVFTAGEAGAIALRKLFPECADKISVRRLGTLKPDVDILSRHHRRVDNRLTFLSVARVEPGKGVDLNYKMLRALAIARESCEIRWIHVGDGSLMDQLRETVVGDCPANLKVDLRGTLRNEKVHDIYCQEDIDWMMLLSEREGLPISLCEALSYGVPVVSTMVEGSDEAIDDDCGVLLAPDPEPEEFVRGMLPYIESEHRYRVMSENAFDRWKLLFDARKLRKSFVEEIRDL